MRGRPKNAATVQPDSDGLVKDSPATSTVHTVQSVERTFDVLEALARAGRPIALSELSTTVNLHISTVHRLLVTLIERGYARQDSATGRYSTGPHLFELTVGSNAQIDVRSEAHPKLEELAAQVGETANLSVRGGDRLIYIDQVQSDRLVRMFTQIGSSAPLYCTGSGKIFLAFAELHNFEHEFNRYLLENRLEPHTTHTIVKPNILREELVKIRERGYSFDNEEMEEGVVCIAAPIFDRAGKLMAAMSISGPSSRLKDGHISTAVAPLVAASSQVSVRLGFKPPTDP